MADSQKLASGSEAGGGRPLLRAGNVEGRSKAASNSQEVISPASEEPLLIGPFITTHYTAAGCKMSTRQFHYVTARSPLVNDGLAEDWVKLARGTAPES